MFKIIYPKSFAAILLSVTLLSGNALAAGSHSGGHDGPHGKQGEASAVSRTIEVVMGDNYFEPESFSVEAGETVRFNVRNEGELVHEFNIGTPEMHADHQEEMMMMMEHGVLTADRLDMEAAKEMQDSMGHGMHDDPNSVLLEPGDSGEVVWTFPEDREVTLEFGCNVPGHYASGMVGEFELTN
ncbi:cupredoxin domain-containing protein [Fodinicurvata halophila]|uniref:Cupredoxin domain-containing protein n=1 Tax=Fodinicurvata halophila TaxID=1419723 RepID=A0ABV8UJ90_9PROT